MEALVTLHGMVDLLPEKSGHDKVRRYFYSLPLESGTKAAREVEMMDPDARTCRQDILAYF